MQMKPLYVLRYHYPEDFAVTVGGEDSAEELHFAFGEGRCEGSVSGSFRAANHPRKRSDGPFEMNMQGIIQTDDGALLICDFRGYGRAYPAGRRQVVGSVRHMTDDSRYAHLNDGIGVLSGEVRRPDHPEPIVQGETQLVFEVSELVWEAPPT